MILTSILSRLQRRQPERKASRVARLVSLEGLGRPVWSPRDVAGLAREGFMRNAIVYRCVRMVCESAAAVPLLLFEGREERTEHPLLDLLARPNPHLSGARLLEALYGHLLVAGNAYLEAVIVEDTVRELHVLRPDRMRVVPGADGWPLAFEYAVGGRTVRIDQTAGPMPPILHLSFFHPLDDHYGFSPLEAAGIAVDTHNAAAAWHKALLDNAARPSGALVYDGPEGGALSQDQYDRLKEELEASFQGALNAGRPLLLEGGLDWNLITTRDLKMRDGSLLSRHHLTLVVPC